MTKKISSYTFYVRYTLKTEKPRRTKKTFDNPDPINLKNWLKIFDLAIYIPYSTFMNTAKVSNTQKCMK